MATTSSKTKKLVQVSMFVAIIVLLSLTPLGYVPLGVTNATTIHIPVIIGSIVLGPVYGAFLGFVFGLTSFLRATFSPTITSFVFSPFYSIGGVSGNFWSLVIAFVPRILIGVVPYYVFQGLRKVLHNDVIDLCIAGICGSLTNTILVMGGIWIFFGDAYAAVQNIDAGLLYKLILSVVCVNGIPEAILAGVISMAVCKVLLKFVVPAAKNTGTESKA